MFNSSERSKKPITPLWIIALFVSLTETVLGIAVIRTAGGIQVALTVFVMVFPLLIGAAFFLILWNKPFVLYPPTEFGGETDVGRYVEAMSGLSRRMDETTLYTNIQEVVRSTITSSEVISALSRGLPPQIVNSAKSEIALVLESAAKETVEKIRETGFVTVDVRKMGVHQRGGVWQLPYERYPTVSDMLDELYFDLDDAGCRIEPFTYGTKWVLRDTETGRRLKEMGRVWAGAEPDNRTLKEVGIRAGMVLEAIPL